VGTGKGKEEVRGRRKEKRARNGKEIRGGEEKEGEGFFLSSSILIVPTLPVLGD